MTNRVYGYGRVSTDDQTTEQQLMVMCNAGYPVEVHRFITDKISGGVRAMERPNFKNLVDNKLEKGDTLVIAKLDRLGRDNIDVQQVVTMLDQMEVKTVILDLPVQDLSSAQGKLMLQMFGAFAEFEKNRISERTKEALAKKKHNGDVLGRPKLEVKDKVQELKTKGLSQNKIKDELKVSLSTVRRNWN